MHHTDFRIQFYTKVPVLMVIGFSVLHAFNVVVVTKVLISVSQLNI
jgi:hypothetical protein